VLGNQQLVVPLVSPDDLIPALPEIAFHVPGGRSFNESVRIVPVVRGAFLFIPAQRRGVVMEVGVPAFLIISRCLPVTVLQVMLHFRTVGRVRAFSRTIQSSRSRSETDYCSQCLLR
jgi:hypothetical protein